MRPSTKVRSDLATTIPCSPGAEQLLDQLRHKYKARCTAKYLRKVIAGFPQLTPEQVSDLQDILASRTTAGIARPWGANSRPAARASVSKNASGVTWPTTPDDESPGHGRTQWDAMTEATSGGRFRATKLALLIFVRYSPRTSAGALTVTLAYKVIVEVLGHHH